ncbi:MAG: putative inorganic polyphosphate/ATP-NAD kinase [Methanoregulaceae archaeon PtaU1.Bin222]|nr:MAG: putative inorganic polyphosphate/ATP-NAD kinase [Methanoregulaceae archaeon PtaU1.Bin222]
MKAVIVCRIDNAEALVFARSIRAILSEEHCVAEFDHDTALVAGEAGSYLAETDADIVIVIGGDGTILRTIQQLRRPVPVLGINWGEVGFLADLEPVDAPIFLRSLVHGFGIEKRMRISLTKDGVLLGTALNEALIVTTRPAKMLRFSIIIDGIVAEQFRADGLLISTPTGSTAYAMSAGGPIVDPRIQGFLLVPLAPYMLSSRPHLISEGRRLEIRLESAKPAKLVLDGQQTVDLGTSSSLHVEKSPVPAQFVDVRRNFFEKVDKKLRNL